MSQDKWTKLARGQECLVRIPSYCRHDTETTVAAHYRLAGNSGTGIKPHSIMAAWACSNCHDLIDGRAVCTEYGRNELRHFHAEGVIRTLEALVRKGHIK